MPKVFAVIGAGVIGSGWAARALTYGHDVIAWDLSAQATDQLLKRVESAWPTLQQKGVVAGASLKRLTLAKSLEACVQDADFIQESAPEQVVIKTELHKTISQAARPDALIASSTSGLLPSEFYAQAQHPERCLVGHPFNPVYLLPLVEVIAGKNTSAQTIESAKMFYQALGMRPLHVRKEVEGFIADRLMEAMWRESLHMINEGVATTAEIDDAIRFGAGLRWAFMGTFLTYTLAGGDAGMRHFMQQFGPALQLPWTKLTAPELSDKLLNDIVEGCDQQLAGRSIAALERYRDDCLIAIQEAITMCKHKHGIDD